MDAALVSVPKSTQWFELLFDAAPDPLLVLDPAGLIVTLNRSANRLLGPDRAAADLSFTRLLSPRSRRAARALTEFLGNTTADAGTRTADIYAILGDGSESPFQLNMSALKVADKSFVMASLIDIASRKQAEDAQQQMTALVESADDAILTKTLDGIVQSWNPAAQRLLGYAADEVIGKSVLQLIPDDRKNEELTILEQIRQGRRVAHFETVRRARDGRLVDVSLMISPVRDRSGAIVGASKIMRDITERRRHTLQLQIVNAELEEQIRARTAELKEREAMVQEIHHRVKNNMQVIISLINMQIRSIAEPSAQTALRECQSRVMTMAQIHEMLYESKDYAQVPFWTFTKVLTSSVLSASALSRGSIALAFELDEIYLPVEQAIPCGLILNELIANALKHAFPAGGPGTITVTLRREAGRVVLAVRDDGVGGSADIPKESRQSLGMHLLRTLTQQIGGQFAQDGVRGSTFRITFPELER